MIAERLKTLRCEQGITKRELVSRLPLNYSTYANYESGFREPNSEVLQLLAKHFCVSIDFLMGVSNNRKTADEIAVLTDDEHNHVTNYRQLDLHGREIVDIILQKELERTIAAKIQIKDKNQQDEKPAVLGQHDPDYSCPIEYSLKLFGTTSPSYPFYYYLEKAAKFSFEKAAYYDTLKKAIDRHTKDLPFIRRDSYGMTDKKNRDFSRLVLDTHKLGTDGKTFYYKLLKNGIAAERFDDRYIVFILSIMDTEEDLQFLCKAIMASL